MSSLRNLHTIIFIFLEIWDQTQTSPNKSPTENEIVEKSAKENITFLEENIWTEVKTKRRLSKINEKENRKISDKFENTANMIFNGYVFTKRDSLQKLDENTLSNVKITTVKDDIKKFLNQNVILSGVNIWTEDKTEKRLSKTDEKKESKITDKVENAANMKFKGYVSTGQNPPRAVYKKGSINVNNSTVIDEIKGKRLQLGHGNYSEAISKENATITNIHQLKNEKNNVPATNSAFKNKKKSPHLIRSSAKNPFVLLSVELMIHEIIHPQVSESISQNNTLLQFTSKPTMIVGIKHEHSPKSKFTRCFTRITINNEKIYHSKEYIGYSKYYKEFSRTPYANVQNYYIQLKNSYDRAREQTISKIQDKILVTYRSLELLKTLHFNYPIRDMREIYCLSKFINVIAYPFKDSGKKYHVSLEDTVYYFLGEHNQLRTSFQINNALEKVYNRFKIQWEKEVGELVKNGKLNQILTEDTSLNYPRETYLGLHCDVFEYSLWILLPKCGYSYYIYALDIEWNRRNDFISSATIVTSSGGIKAHYKGPLEFHSELYSAFRDELIIGYGVKNCRYILIGHGMLSQLIKIIGQYVINYKNFYDLQLYFYLKKNEPIDNTLMYLAEKYLYIRLVKEPNSWLRAKICMQLYQLYKYDLGIDEDSYEQSIMSASNESLSDSI